MRAITIVGLCALAFACGGKTDTAGAGSAGSAGSGGAPGSSMQSSTTGATGGSVGGSSSGAGGSVEPGPGCSINSDCNQPLVCAFKRCHLACDSTRDCPPGLRCIHAVDVDTGVLLGNVCQLSSDRHSCSINSDCPGTQICGIDAQCRDQCDADRDCVSGQVCRVHTCADPVELNDGGTLGQVLDGGTKADGG
jgi:hypothetical protein